MVTITDKDMESRKRIARLQSGISDAIAQCGRDATYAELLIVLGRLTERWASHLRKEELEE